MIETDRRNFFVGSLMLTTALQLVPLEKLAASRGGDKLPPPGDAAHAFFDDVVRQGDVPVPVRASSDAGLFF